MDPDIMSLRFVKLPQKGKGQWSVRVQSVNYFGFIVERVNTHYPSLCVKTKGQLVFNVLRLF